MVQYELAGATDALPLHHVVLPSIQCTWHHSEVRILKEQVNDTFLHVVLLALHLLIDVLLNSLRRVASIDQVLLHCSCIAHVLIPAHHNSTLSVNGVCNVKALFLVMPSLEVMP